MRRRLAATLAAVVVSAGVFVISSPAAQAAPCGGTYTIAVGGFNDPTSGVFTGNVSQRVGYSAQLTGASAREGVNELNRLIRDQRAVCPGQHAKVVGYSEGAAVAHTWVSENWQTFDNVNAVLIADPKRAAGPGASGLSGQFYSGVVGPPLAGADNNFGDIPTVTICTDDVICDSTAASGWPGYLSGKHGNYDFNVDAYSDDADGQWFNGEFLPWN
jgi:cutinase